jgi:hypothetical protein
MQDDLRKAVAAAATPSSHAVKDSSNQWPRSPLAFGPISEAHLRDDVIGEGSFLIDIDAVIRGASPPACYQGHTDYEEGLVSSNPLLHAAELDAHFAFLLCLSPEINPDRFRNRLRSFPGIARLSTIWLQPWNREAYFEVAEAVLVPDAAQGEFEDREALRVAAKVASQLPATILEFDGVCCSPLLFVTSLKLLHGALASRRAEFERHAQDLQVALQLLSGAESTAKDLALHHESIAERAHNEVGRQAELENDLRTLQTQLYKEQDVLVEFNRQLEPLEEELKTILEGLNGKIATQLSKLENAKAYIEVMTKAQILECQLVDHPPVQLSLTLMPMLIALHLPERWSEVVDFLGKEDCMKRLLALTPHDMTEDQLERINDHVTDILWGENLQNSPGGAFATACAGLIRALLAAGQMWQKLKSESCGLEELSTQVDVLRTQVQKAKNDAQGTETMVDALEDELRVRANSAKAARLELDESKIHMSGTEELTVLLRRESQRWNDRLQLVKGRLLKQLPGNLLLAAFLAHYAGALQKQDRDYLLARWRTICEEAGMRFDADLSMLELLRTLESERANAANAADIEACPNPCSAQICLLCGTPQFLSDPMDVGRPWLLNHLANFWNTSPTISTPSLQTQSSHYQEILRAAAKRHAPVIVDLVDSTLPGTLEQALSCEPPVSAALPEDLRIFFVSNSQPEEYLGVGATQQGATIVDFSVELSSPALRAQLLETILQTEAPELRSVLLESRSAVASAAATLHKLECSMLSLIAKHAEKIAGMSNKGDAGTMKNTIQKEQTETVGEGGSQNAKSSDILREVLQLQAKIEDCIAKQRVAVAEVKRSEEKAAQWEPLAKTAFAFYGALIDTRGWHSAYRCSWRRFNQWLSRALAESSAAAAAKKQQTEEARITSFRHSAASMFYSTMKHGFFPCHRLAFAFRMAVRLGEADGSLIEGEVDDLLSIFSKDIVRQFSGVSQASWSAGDPPAWFGDLDAWQRISKLAIERPPIRTVLHEMQRDDGSHWAWLAAARSGEWPSQSETNQTIYVPRLELPDIPRLVPDAVALSLLDEFFVTCALAPRLAIPALRRYVEQELGSLGGDLPPAAAFSEGLAAAEALRTASNSTIVLISEKTPSVELHSELLHWLETAAAAKGAIMSTFSSLQRNCAELAARELEQSLQVRPRWVFVPNISRKAGSIPSLLALARQIAEGIGGSQGALLVLGMPGVESSGAGPFPLPPGVLDSAPRVVIAPPLGLRAQLRDLIEHEADGDSNKEERYARLRPVSALHAGLLWIYCSLSRRALLNVQYCSGAGWAQPYAWNATDLLCTIRVLEDHSAHGLTESGKEQLATLAVLLGFGVHMEDETDRTALQAIIEDMASLHGPLEVWRRLLPPVAAEALSTTVGLEELQVWVDTAMPEEDTTAHPDYLALACGLSPGRASLEGSDGCLDQAWALLNTLQACSSGSPSRELSSVKNEEAVLVQIRELQDEIKGLASTVSSCVSQPDLEQTGSQDEVPQLPVQAAISHKMSSISADQSNLSESGHGRMSEVLQQELLRLLTELTVVLGSLETTADVLKGNAQGWSQEAQIVCNTLWRKEVPSSWDLPDGVNNIGGGSLISWQHAVRNRVHMLSVWFLDGPPLSYWLGGFSYPQMLLNAILQIFSKKHAVELDMLHIAVETTSIAAPARPSHPEDYLCTETIQRPARGVFVHGLALCGARWALSEDGLSGALDFCSPGIEEAPWLPLLNLIPVLEEERARGNSNMRCYSCPVYGRLPSSAGSSSAKQLLFLDMASTQEPRIWALRGIAIFLEPIV